jgi:lipopolysaccharide transport system ATP-binding protein
MSLPALSVDSLSKEFRLGARNAGYRTFREAVMDLAAGPLRRLKNGRAQDEAETLWALRDVSFDVQPGEVVGIIGRNGAGKSTLLKVLSRITKPSRGRIRIRGRVASLLEVGTGFHPELTGRENIFLNGAILGMTRREIARKFDEIVQFAEVDRFIDTPVKRYSSGMYLRLAFGVAAHLEPEILVIDEVLAVGDASFQRKCLSKMEDVGRHGRTVLFVSHSMTAINRLCSRAILLERGTIIDDGISHRVTSSYLRSDLGTTAARRWQDDVQAPGNDIVRLRSVRVCSEDGQTRESFDIRYPIGIEMVYEVIESGYVLVPNLHLYNEEGICVFVASDSSSEWRRRIRPVQQYRSTMWIPGNLLSEGSIVVHAAISTMDPVTVHLFERDAIAFQVVDNLEGASARGDYAGPIPGVIRPLLDWVTHIQS